jgi:glycosyltransferase involved in cell wall biosynthesis
MKVLYVSHTAVVSGAEQVLLLALRSARERIQPAVACPPGPLADAARDLGVPVYLIPGTDLSARLHPVHTPRELAKVVRTMLAVRAIAARLQPDVIHANTHRAGLMTVLARSAHGAKPVIQVHDALPPGRLPQLLFGVLAASSAGFLTTTRYLAATFPRTHIPAVVPNAVDPREFDPSHHDRRQARSRLGLGDEEPVLAVIGQISPHKAQSDAIEATALVRERHPDVRLLLVGSPKFASRATRFDNRTYDAELRRLADRLDMAEATRFLGERTDIAEILAAVDLLLVPSWYEPFGLVAAEAMMMGVPVVATSVGGITEVVIEGESGLLLAPRRPGTWARAIGDLLSDPARRAAMGVCGRDRVLREFVPERVGSDVVAFYERTLSAGTLSATTSGFGPDHG